MHKCPPAFPFGRLYYFRRLDLQCCDSPPSLTRTDELQAAFFDDLCRPFAAFLVLARTDSSDNKQSHTNAGVEDVENEVLLVHVIDITLVSKEPIHLPWI